MSSKTSKKYKLRIRWTLAEHLIPEDLASLDGYREPEQKERTYDFRTKQERDIFMKGVEQAIGWSEYEILKEKEYDE